MLNTSKILIMLLTLAVLLLLPRTSYAAWEDQHGRDHGRGHHGYGFHAHANPDLTLVSGMEDIDSRVLIAGPDPTPEVIDQPAPEIVVITPAQIPGPGVDTFIINVPNQAGGYTPVLIKKWGNGYLGPQGELYYPFPEVAQLKDIYGI
jgi:hypothetical protein